MLEKANAVHPWVEERARSRGHGHCAGRTGGGRAGADTAVRSACRTDSGGAAAVTVSHLHRHRDRGGATAWCQSADWENPVAGADRHRRRDRAERRAGSGGFPEPPPDRRIRERHPEQPVSARHQLSRLHRLAAPRDAARPVGLHGRCPPQPAVRRGRELGPDSSDGDRDDDADAGIESAVRPEHAGGSAGDSNQERPARRRGRPSRRSTAPTRDAQSNSSTAARDHSRRHPLVHVRQSASRRMGGATTLRPRSASCSASSGGSGPATTRPSAWPTPTIR